MAIRNSDFDLRSLVRAYLANPGDLAAYEKVLAKEVRSGIPVGTNLSPNDVETYALVLRYRVHSGELNKERLMTAAHLGFEPARLAAAEWEYIGWGERKLAHVWDNDARRTEFIAQLDYKRPIVSYATDCAERMLANHAMDYSQRMLANYEMNMELANNTLNMDLGSDCFTRCIESARRWVSDPTERNRSLARFTAQTCREALMYSVWTHLSNACIGCVSAAAVNNLGILCTYASDSAINRGGDRYYMISGNHTIDQPWVIHRFCLYLLGEISLPDARYKASSNRRNSLRNSEAVATTRRNSDDEISRLYRLWKTDPSDSIVKQRLEGALKRLGWILTDNFGIVHNKEEAQKILNRIDSKLIDIRVKLYPGLSIYEEIDGGDASFYNVSLYQYPESDREHYQLNCALVGKGAHDVLLNHILRSDKIMINELKSHARSIRDYIKVDENYERLPNSEVSNPRPNKTRRNIDLDKRSLERAWQDSRSLISLQAWLRSMIREGDTSRFPMYRMERIAAIEDDTESNCLDSIVWLGLANRHEILDWENEINSLIRKGDDSAQCRLSDIVGENRCETYELGERSPTYERLDLDNNMMRRLRIPLNGNNYILEMWDLVIRHRNEVGLHLIRESDGLEMYHGLYTIPRGIVIDDNRAVHLCLAHIINEVVEMIHDIEIEIENDEDYEMLEIEKTLMSFKDDFLSLERLLDGLGAQYDQLSKFNIED